MKMKMKQYFFILLLVFAGSLSYAQNNKPVAKDTSVSFKVFGACVQCKARIEGAVKGNSSKKRNASFIGRGMVVGGLMNGAAGVATGGLIGAARGLIKKGEEAEISPGTEFNMILNQSVTANAFR